MIERLHLPTSADEALNRLTASPGATVLAGGTLLMAEVNNTATEFTDLVSTRRIGGTAITVADGRATVGAAATLAALGQHDELAVLRSAVDSIGSPTLRNMATVGGNLFARQPYGDLAVCFVALDATVHLLGADGASSAPAAEFVSMATTDASLVTDVSFDVPAVDEWFYTKAMRRTLNSASIVTIAARVEMIDDTVATARVALGGCGPTPRRAPQVEAALVGSRLDAVAIDAAADASLDDADCFDDAYASAWYRRRVLPVHVRRTLTREGSAS